MKAYEAPAPLAGPEAKFRMVPIPGGTFKLGSPATEAGRKADEGPQKSVTVEPFWMGEVEVTWALYRDYYDSGKARKKNGFLSTWDKAKPLEELLTQPTPQYHDMFDNGLHNSEDDYPAMDMTNHAASKFCEWLSAQTGHYYRLPTEAEWEWAARGGTKTAYSWGDDAKAADDYAWHKENSNLTYNEVKQKKPNGYGLYDMHGNVSEWTIDQYDAKAYEKLADGSKGPWNVPTKRYARVYKGGSYVTDAKNLRPAARFASDAGLKDLDPQIPKSVWYHTYGQHIGFRLVRPLKVPSADEAHKAWNSDFWSPERNIEDVVR